MTTTTITLGVTQNDLTGIQIKIHLDSLHDMPDALEFESRRLLSLTERHIGLTSDERYWDSKRRITIRQETQKGERQ